VRRGRGRAQSDGLLKLRNRSVQIAGFDMEHREIVVQTDVVWIGAQHHLVANDVLRQELRAQAAFERRTVGRPSGHHLNLEIAHLIGSALAVGHSPSGGCTLNGTSPSYPGCESSASSRRAAVSSIISVAWCTMSGLDVRNCHALTKRRPTTGTGRTN